jgi:death on curing protein
VTQVDYPDYEYLLAVNQTLTGDGLVRDAGALASAIARPQATVFGDDAYPTIWEKAAALLQSLACNHAFVEGNKRTAWVATATFLDVNGNPLDPRFSQQDAETLVLAVATGRLRDVQAIASELVKFSRH